jgi:hypothetical protein
MKSKTLIPAPDSQGAALFPRRALLRGAAALACGGAAASAGASVALAAPAHVKPSR